MDEYGRLRALVRKARAEELERLEDTEGFHRGREAGRAWAIESATLDQLERLRRAYTGSAGQLVTIMNFDTVYNGFDIRQSDSQSWELVALVILNKKYDSEVFAKFWSPWLDKSLLRTERKLVGEFTSGFAHAAVRAWEWVSRSTDISDVGAVAATSLNLQKAVNPAA